MRIGRTIHIHIIQENFFVQSNRNITYLRLFPLEFEKHAGI